MGVICVWCVSLQKRLHLVYTKLFIKILSFTGIASHISGRLAPHIFLLLSLICSVDLTAHPPPTALTLSVISFHILFFFHM